MQDLKPKKSIKFPPPFHFFHCPSSMILRWKKGQSMFYYCLDSPRGRVCLILIPSGPRCFRYTSGYPSECCRIRIVWLNSGPGYFTYIPSAFLIFRILSLHSRSGYFPYIPTALIRFGILQKSVSALPQNIQANVTGSGSFH